SARGTAPPIAFMRSMPVMVVTGIMPGSTGLVTPSSASSPTRRVHSSTSKKNCVTAKSATASFSARNRRSEARSGDLGWPSGWAATPTEKSPISRANAMRSMACSNSEVAAERHDVLHAGLGVVLQEVTHLGARMADADDVRHGGHVAVVFDLRDEVVGALA